MKQEDGARSESLINAISLSGLALLLPHCPQVDIVEYVPSTRLNGRCHYYSKEVRQHKVVLNPH